MSGRGRVARLAMAAGAAILVGGLIAYHADGAAIVGPPRAVPVTNPDHSVRSLEQIKAEYRRPISIPFPKHNPYTVAKALLGKKLYFDPRLSAGNLLSC